MEHYSISVFFERSRYFIETLEKRIGVGQSLVYFFIVVWVRNILETLLEAKHVLTLQLELHAWLVDMLHVASSWAVLFILMSIGVAWCSDRSLIQSNRVLLRCFPLIWIPPLWDAFWGTSGQIIYQQDFQYFASSFIGLFNPAVDVSYVTDGVRIEIAVAVLLVGFYIFMVREASLLQRVLASIAGAFWVYCCVFLLGFLPAFWFELLANNQGELLARSVLGVDYTLSTLLWYLPIMLVIFPYWLRRSSCAMWQALCLSLRPSRILVYLSICNLSFISASFVGLVGWDWLNPYDIGLLVLLNLSLIFAFVSMAVLNDIYDADIDALSNQERPLICGAIERRDFILLGVFSGGLALLLSIAVNDVGIMLMLTILFLGILYSAPPMRLRQYAGVGHIILAAIAACVYLYGAIPIMGNLSFQQVDAHQWLSIIVLFFIGVHFKDIKDIDGDRVAGVSTLATCMGEKYAYWFIGICMIVTMLGLIGMGYLGSSFLTWMGLCIFSVGWWWLKDAEKTFWVMLLALGVIFLPA